MDKGEVVLIFFIGMSLTANVALAIAWIRSIRRAGELERRLFDPGPGDRPDRLEQVVDGLAAQVDQLVSGQEFLNRVVSERLDKVARGAPEKT